jgi:hypothetical protein
VWTLCKGIAVRGWPHRISQPVLAYPGSLPREPCSRPGLIQTIVVFLPLALLYASRLLLRGTSMYHRKRSPALPFVHDSDPALAR